MEKLLSTRPYDKNDIAQYNPDTEIPDLKDKVIFITGGTGKLGRIAIENYVRHGASQIFFTGRDCDASEEVIAKCKDIDPSSEVIFLETEFTDLLSVRKTAKVFAASSNRLDLLICNAGVLGVKPGTTSQSYEHHMGVNHMAHALLIQAFLPILTDTQTKISHDVRIILVSSLAYQLHPTIGGAINFQTIKTPQDYWSGLGPLGGLASWQRYGASRLANILYAQELCKRYPDILSVAVDPGFVFECMAKNMSKKDQMWLKMNPFNQILTPEEGTNNLLYVSTTSREMLGNGVLYCPLGKVATPRRAATDAELRAQLWAWTEDQLKAFSVVT